ncbi:MAG: hypothetical protein JWL93_2910 [Hyphomicrobiales bacterium]|nr:hypothetical protein [Hyphomicrobiales bacterium]
MEARLTSLTLRVKLWAAAVKRDVMALWIAGRDPRVPWVAKAVAGLVAAYALSPIDLIPDFVPVLGYLDDLILVPAGIMLAVSLIPPALLNEFRLQAEARLERPTSRAGVAMILVLWVLSALLLFWLFTGEGAAIASGLIAIASAPA